MKNLTETIFGFLSRKPTIYFVIGFWILTNALMFPLLMKLRTLSGTMIPDVIPRHNAHVLTNIFTAYGTDGMTVYGKVAFYDIFYPIGYALFFGLLIYLLFKKSKLKYLAWMPILAAIFDHIENYYLGKIVANLPTIDPGTAALTGNLVLIKMLLIGVSMLSILFGLVKTFVLKRSSSYGSI